MNNTLTIGDFLMRPKMLGFIQHVGVWIGSNSVLHNTPTRGEHVSTLAEFSAGEPVTARRTGADTLGVMARVQRVLSSPRKFHAVNRNCEHTANEVVHGKPASRQLLLWVVAILVTLYFVFKGK